MFCLQNRTIWPFCQIGKKMEKKNLKRYFTQKCLLLFGQKMMASKLSVTLVLLGVTTWCWFLEVWNFFDKFVFDESFLTKFFTNIFFQFFKDFIDEFFWQFFIYIFFWIFFWPTILANFFVEFFRWMFWWILMFPNYFFEL